MARYCADWKPDEVPSVGPERLVFGGRQRFQHRPLLEELLLDQLDAREDLEAGVETIVAHEGDRRLELVDHQLHPQLGRLMLDDEEHLVVPGGTPPAPESGCCAVSSLSSRR